MIYLLIQKRVARFLLSDAELADAMNYAPPKDIERCCWYGLTKQGADKRQAVAQPNWDRFHRQLLGAQHDVRTFISADRDFAE